MNRTNEAQFNRPPRRQIFDVVVDSSNRDKVKYPESNDYQIAVPGGPYRSCRTADILQMRVPYSESLVHHMQHPSFISKTAHNTQLNARHSYDQGTDTLCFREGYPIGAHNDLFRFTCAPQVYSLMLPHTLTPVESYWCEDDCLFVRCGHASRLVAQCKISVICMCDHLVNTTYTVLEVLDTHTLVLVPDDGRSLAYKGNGGFLYLPPPANAEELAQYVQAMLVAVHQIECRIDYSRHDGTFVIIKPDGSHEKRRCLLGDETDVLRCCLPSGPHSLEEVGLLIQRMINPPCIVLDQCDRLVFSERWQPEKEIVIEPGYYSPETLAQRIAELLSSASERTNFIGCYNDGRFTFRTHDGSIFALHLQKCPMLAFLLGFAPAFLSDRPEYTSKELVVYRSSTCGIAHATNLYSVALDPLRSQFSLHRNGQLEVKVKELKPLDAQRTLVTTDGPHAFYPGEVLLIHPDDEDDEHVSPGLCVVLQVQGWNRLVLALPLRGGAGIKLCCILSAVPKPFTLPLHLPEATIATVLGFNRCDHIDIDCCYGSDTKCTPAGPLYLLLEIPELLAASEGTNPRLTAQFGLDQPYRTFNGRLDRYVLGSAFDFTQFGPGNSDLFTGNTITVDCITVRLIKPNGALYDCQKIDHSLVLRIVVES